MWIFFLVRSWKDSLFSGQDVGWIWGLRNGFLSFWALKVGVEDGGGGGFGGVGGSACEYLC